MALASHASEPSACAAQAFVYKLSLVAPLLGFLRTEVPQPTIFLILGRPHMYSFRTKICTPSIGVTLQPLCIRGIMCASGYCTLHGQNYQRHPNTSGHITCCQARPNRGMQSRHFSRQAAMVSRSTMAHSQHSSTLAALKIRRRLRPNMPAAVSTRLNSGASPVSNWHLQGAGVCIQKKVSRCMDARHMQGALIQRP